MLDYLKKFNNLPKDLRDRFASPEVLVAVSEIEKKYNVSLATLIMRVLIKDIAMLDLAKFLVFEFSLDARRAEDLVADLNDQVFVVAADYLGLDNTEPEDILEKVDMADDRAMKLARDNMAIRTSSFFFSPDDEKEIQELTKKVAEQKKIMESQANIAPPSFPQPQIQPLEKKVDAVMQKMDLNFSSEDLDNRFKTVVETYLRGVRNRIDTKQTLIKDVNVGGLSLGEEAINNVLDRIDEVKKKYEEPKPVRYPSDSNIGNRDVDYDFRDLKKETSDQTQSVNIETGVGESDDNNKGQDQDQDQDKAKELPRVKSTFKNFAFIDDSQIKAEDIIVPAFNQATPPPGDVAGGVSMSGKNDLLHSIKERAQAIDINNTKKEETVAPKRTSPSQPIVQNRVENKKRMDDVKYVPKLVSPLEELRIMNLLNFRRLGTVPKDAKDRIKEKIDFLEEESYTKRLEGVKAWRQSPLNKLYITIGQEAISQDGGIRAIIKERQDSGQDFLSEDEFDAIMDLNKNLRF